MPKSKSRAKKSKGKAWRTGRTGSEYETTGPAGAATDFGVALPDGLLEALTEALAEDGEQFYGDEHLGRVLVRRGWEPLHVHVDDSSDSWSWPESAPDGDSWVHTVVTVLEGSYLVQYADFESLMQNDHADFGSREELIDALDAIESYRHRADPRL